MDPIFRGSVDFLGPFWDSVLDRTVDEVARDATQLAFWAKVNGAWLGTRTTEVRAPSVSVSDRRR